MEKRKMVKKKLQAQKTVHMNSEAVRRVHEKPKPNLKSNIGVNGRNVLRSKKNIFPPPKKNFQKKGLIACRLTSRNRPNLLGNMFARWLAHVCFFVLPGEKKIGAFIGIFFAISHLKKTWGPKVRLRYPPQSYPSQ